MVHGQPATGWPTHVLWTCRSSVDAAVTRCHHDYHVDPVPRFDELGGGWHAVRLQTRRSLEELPREGHLVALSLGRPPQGNPMDFVARFGSTSTGRG
jgi:hypothetical protein